MRLSYTKYPTEMNIEKYVKGVLTGLSLVFLRRFAAYCRDRNMVGYVQVGVRSVEYQQRLYENDLARNGGKPSGMVATPGTSWHHFGGAIDLADMHEPHAQRYWMPYSRLNQNLNEYGLMCPLNNVDGTVREWWHIQPIETNGVSPWKRAAFLSSDMAYGILRGNALRIGAKGESVKEVQRMLNKAGYDIKVDGIYGKQTEAAVRLLQTRYPVCGKNDGIVGKRTYPILMEIARKR